MSFWPDEDISFWISTDNRVQVFSPAYGFEGNASRDPKSLKFDETLEKRLLEKYVVSNTNVASVIQEFGDPTGSLPFRFVCWDFPNGDRVSLLYGYALTNANGPMEVVISDIEVKNFQAADVPDSELDWGFVLYYVKGYDGSVLVKPKMLGKEGWSYCSC